MGSRVPITSREILWADFIVIPFTTQPLKEVYEHIRKINPKAVIAFHLDFNFYEIPKTDPLKDMFDEENIQNIEDNIFHSSVTYCANPALMKYVDKKFSSKEMVKRYKDDKTEVQLAVYPMLIDLDTTLENVPKEPGVREDTSLRIGVFASDRDWANLNAWKKQLYNVQEKHGDKVKFVVFGFDGIHPETEKSCFIENFQFEYIKPCSIVHYYKQIQELYLDFLFVPAVNNVYNKTSRSYTEFIDASIFQVPLIIPDVEPLSDLIRSRGTGDEKSIPPFGIVLDKKDGLLDIADKYVKTENREEIYAMGEMAQRAMYDTFAYHDVNVPKFDALMQ